MQKKLKKPDLKRIRITDELFGQYAGRIGEKILDYQWKILTDDLEGSEPTYCIENFRIAAGEKKGERKGVVFQDTDLYKWLESVAFSIAGGMAGIYEEKADEVIDLISRAQESDGYLNTYFQINAPERKWKNLIEGHELYTSGHMMEAAAAYYVITGKEKILEVARKNADLICRVFGKEEGQIHGYPGHEEVEVGLIKLYKVTGEKRYLEQAKYFIDERGTEPNYIRKEEAERNGEPEFFPEFKDYDLEYSQAHKPPREQTEAVGHAVRDMYMCAAMADLAEEYEDKGLENACIKIWDNMTKRRMYITGGIGSSGFRERFTTDYDLPNDSGYCETCASIGLMMFGQRMASLTGKASYYDEVERALYNTVLAGINIEGNRYFYVNPLEVVPQFCTEHTSMQHVKAVRQKWFSVACCPPNIARTLASLGQYIYALGDDALYIHQFISSSIKTEVNEANISLEMASDLLESGKVSIKAEVSAETALMIRVPGFSKSGDIRVDGTETDVDVADGYVRLGISSGSHTIELKFDTAPKWLAANNNVRENAGKMALMKGPMVYCLEEEDNGDHLSEVYVKQGTEIEVDKPDERLAGRLPVLKYKGYRVKSAGVGSDELYGEVKFEKEETELKAVPYSQWNNRSDGEMLVWQKAVI